MTVPGLSGVNVRLRQAHSIFPPRIHLTFIPSLLPLSHISPGSTARLAQSLANLKNEILIPTREISIIVYSYIITSVLLTPAPTRSYRPHRDRETGQTDGARCVLTKPGDIPHTNLPSYQGMSLSEEMLSGPAVSV